MEEKDSITMQSLFDNFCRCFGAPVSAADMEVLTDSADGSTGGKVVSSTPDMKRRTRSLKLQDEQWDALFDCNSTRPSRKKYAPTDDVTMEQARAVARAKLEANGGKPQKRKRQTAEDIFRSKKSPATREEPPANPFSRFLSNNPVIAHSLCFATPIRDPDEPDVEDYNSVVSESHTAEDTMTSTVYYEQVKLAGLKQKNPPMPLFNVYEIKAGDELRDVVEADSHSSVMMKEWVLRNPQVLNAATRGEQKLTPPTSPTRYEGEDPPTPMNDDDVPPMVNSSSSSGGARSV
jgi:hypothetical protein